MAASRSGALARRRATYQDVLDAPPHQVAEIVDGTLHTHPRPAMPHARASSMLGVELGGPFDRGRGGPGGWWIIDEPELHLGEDILVPDLAGWRRERMPEYPDTAYVTLAPDWVCEVLSPSTRRLDLQGKRPIYAREEVQHLWLVEPTDRTLEAFELREGEWVLIATAKDDDPDQHPAVRCDHLQPGRSLAVTRTRAVAPRSANPREGGAPPSWAIGAPDASLGIRLALPPRRDAGVPPRAPA